MVGQFLTASLLPAGLIFTLSSLFYVRFFFVQKNDHGFWASIFASTGWVLFTAREITRFATIRTWPFDAFTEGLLWLGWMGLTVYFMVEWKFHIKVAGAVVLPVVSGIVFYGLTAVPDSGHILPILESPWVLIHVTAVFLGYSLFSLASLAGVLYLVQENEIKSRRLTFMHFRLPDLATLERLWTLLISAGFPLLSVGIVAGAIWSNQVWGTYMPWDPKLVWALLTWVIYGLYLGIRYFRGWQGRRLAMVTVAGFLAVIFNYFGVSFLMNSLHHF